jgi:hypothetical protein
MKKLIILIIVYCALLIPGTRDIYTQSITWQKTYDVFRNDFGYKILPAPGNCFYFAGYIDNIITSYSYILKIDQFGDTLWSNRIAGGLYSAALSHDSCCVIVNLADSLNVVKIDRDGNIVWNKTIPAGGIPWDIQRIYDNGFVLCGNIGLSAFVIRIDYKGNFLWKKIFSGGTKGFYSSAESLGNGVVLTGYNQGQDSTKIYVVKLDYDGNLIWEKNYAANNNRNSGQKVCALNNNYLIGGNTDYFNRKTFIIKIDTSGSLLQSKVWIPYGTSQEFFDDIVSVNSNKLIVSKRVDSSSTLYTYAKAQLIDSNLNLIKEQVYYPSYSYAIFSSILPLPNKDILFAGTFDYYTNWVERRYDLYAVRTDSNLNTAVFPPIGIAGNNQNLPDKYILHQNFPNPFNPVTKILYELSARAFVELCIYDIKGTLVKNLIKDNKNTGKYEIEFNGANLSTGIYLYTLFVNGKLQNTKKMAFLK